MRWIKATLFCFTILCSTVSAMADEYKTTVLAGGCFWCIEHDLQSVDGIIDVHSGYSGGDLENPSYEDVSLGDTGHIESVQIKYDPAVIPYEDLLKIFWTKVDPFDSSGQFCDRGPQYRAAVFVANESEKDSALKIKKRLSQQLGQPVVTEIIDFKSFYPAEDYHQDYAQNNPVRYQFYRWNCGRDQRLQAVWK